MTLRLIHVGFACNNACRFCAQGDLRTRRLQANVEAELAEIGASDRVAFVGGEPTEFEALCSWIEGARRAGASRILVQTNGRRLSEADTALRLKAAGVSSLDVSLCGSNAAMHDYHTRVPGSFAATVAGLAQAFSVGLPFATTTVVTRANYRHLEETVTLSARCGARAVHLAQARPFGHLLQDHALIPPAVLARPQLAAAIIAARTLGIQYTAGPQHSDASVRELFAGIGIADMGA